MTEVPSRIWSDFPTYEVYAVMSEAASFYLKVESQQRTLVQLMNGGLQDSMVEKKH